MKVAKLEIFVNVLLVTKFINANNIPKEDIIAIIYSNDTYQLFYFK